MDETLKFSHVYQVLLYQGTDEDHSRFANQDSILLTDIKGREKERLQRGQSSLDLEAGNFSLEAPGDAAEHGGSDNLSGASSIFVLDNDPAVEKKWKPGVLAGYPMSAAFIVLDKDRGTALFKRFDEPSMRNLLYLQSRVACLAAKQEKFDKEDFASDNSSITRRLTELESRLKARLEEVPDPPTTFIFRVGNHREDWRRRVALAVDKMDKYGQPVELPHLRLDDLEGCIANRVQSPTNSMRENLHLIAHYTEIFGTSKGKDREREHNIEIYPRLEVRRDLPFRRRLGNLIYYIARILDVLPGPLLLDLLNYVSTPAATHSKIASATLEDILSQHLDQNRPELDPPSLLTEIDHILTSLEVFFEGDLKEYLRDKLVPDAPYFAAKSWEDFEMFSRSYELMPKRQQEWEEEHPSKPWPFANMSEKWVEKMEQRWNLAMEMKQALKEYRKHTGDTNLSNHVLTDVDEALLLQQKLFKLAKPAGRTRKAVWKWYLTSYSDIQQFLGNSLVDLVGEDIVALRTAGEEDTVSNILSRYFAYFFLVSFASAIHSTISGAQNFHTAED